MESNINKDSINNFYGYFLIIKTLFLKHKLIFLFIGGFLICLFIFFLLFFLFAKNSFKKWRDKIIEYLFTPTPKILGRIGRFLSIFLHDKYKYLISLLYNKINNEYTVSIIIGVKNSNLKKILEGYKIEEINGISVYIWEKNALILINDYDPRILDQIIVQLQSYSPVITNIITNIENIDKLETIQNFQDEIRILINKFFIVSPNILLLHNIEIQDINNFQSSYIPIYNNQGVNYSFMNNKKNILSDSYINGCATYFFQDYMEVMENNLNKIPIENIQHKGIILSINNNLFIKNNYNIDNVFKIFNNTNNFTGTFKNNPYIKFWKNTIRNFTIGIFLYCFIYFGLLYFEYRKLYNTILKGNEILFHQEKIQLGIKELPEEVQFKMVQEFVHSIEKLKMKILKSLGRKKTINTLQNYFLRVYKSCIFNIYNKKINDLLQEINNNTANLLREDSKNLSYSVRNFKDLPGFIHWTIFIEKVEKMHLLLNELKNMFNIANSQINNENNNKNNINYVEKKINNIVGGENILPIQSQEITNLIKNTITKIQDNCVDILNIMINSLMNKDILLQKKNLHNLLAKMTQDYLDNTSVINFNNVDELLKETEEFIKAIKSDFYNFLDSNEFVFPENIRENIKFLEKFEYVTPYLHDRINKNATEKLQSFKKTLFNLEHTFLSPANAYGTREEFLNSGDTNLSLIAEVLNDLLSNEFIQIIKNNCPNNYQSIGIEKIKDNIIVWDIKKLEAVEKITETYHTLQEKWNYFNNNIFLFIINKLLNNNFNQLIRWTIDQSIIMEKNNNNKLNLQKNNFQESMGIFKKIYKYDNNIFLKVPIIKKALKQQIKIISTLILSSIQNLWFFNLTPERWDGESSIIEAVIKVQNITALNEIFLRDFTALDNSLNSDIVPFVDILVNQEFLTEEDLPYEFNSICDIMSTVSSYKNQQINSLKDIEEQLINYCSLRSYDLFKLKLKSGSSGNFFAVISDNLHNVIVTTAKLSIKKLKIKEYNKIVEFFNGKCSKKIPFVFDAVDAVELSDLMTLKNLCSGIDEIIYVFEQDSNQVINSKKIQFLKFLKTFFGIVDVNEAYCRVKFNMELQYEESGTANDAVIMRWHSYLGENESHNNKIFKDVFINNHDRFQILMDIAKDSSIDVIEYKKIVPMDRGCLVFADSHWGLWRFIGSYYFKENEDSIILSIKIPIVVSRKPIEQQWIVTYVKISKIPTYKEKAELY